MDYYIGFPTHAGIQANLCISKISKLLMNANFYFKSVGNYPEGLFCFV
jgi:hypothetical protein